MKCAAKHGRNTCDNYFGSLDTMLNTYVLHYGSLTVRKDVITAIQHMINNVNNWRKSKKEREINYEQPM